MKAIYNWIHPSVGFFLNDTTLLNFAKSNLKKKRIEEAETQLLILEKKGRIGKYYYDSLYNIKNNQV